MKNRFSQQTRHNYTEQLMWMKDAASQMVARIRSADEKSRTDLRNAPRVPNLKSADQLLADFCSEARREVTEAEKLLHASADESWFRRPFAIIKARRALKEAKARFDDRLKDANRPDVIASRQATADRMQDQQALHISRRNAAAKAAAKLEKVSQLEDQLKTLIDPLWDAIRRNAWIAEELGDILDEVASEIKKERLHRAIELLGAAQYQRLPSELTMEAWIREREIFIARIEQSRSGFSAVAPFQELVSYTLETIQKGCPGKPWNAAMAELEHWSDRWHAIPRCLVSPTHLAEPVQWILYWAILGQIQLFSEDLNGSVANEDVLTGTLTAMLRQELRGWGKSRLKDLGYPSAKVDLDLVQIAGTRGEYLTGADLGVIVRVDVGDLKVHKAALLQAKISENGKANIGSKPSGARNLTQLQKLCDERRDHFLFYHTAKGSSPAMLPTVSLVQHFVESYKLDEAGLARERITVETRGQGIDLASFMAFGLCRSLGQGMGRDVLPEQDALEVLSSGGAKVLPNYVLVVSMTDGDRSYEHVLSKLADLRYRGHSEKKGVTLARAADRSEGLEQSL